MKFLEYIIWMQTSIDNCNNNNIEFIGNEYKSVMSSTVLSDKDNNFSNT